MGRKSPPGRGLSRRLRPAGLLAHCPQRSRPRSVARGRPGQRPSGLQMSQPPPRALPARALPPRALPPRALPPRGATRKEEKEARPAQTDEQGRERERSGEREAESEGGRAEGNRKIIYGDEPRCIGEANGRRREGQVGGRADAACYEQRRRELFLTPPLNRRLRRRKFTSILTTNALRLISDADE